MANPINFSVAAAQRSGSFSWGSQSNPNTYPGGYSIISWNLIGMGVGAGSDYENAANSFTATIWFSTDGGTTWKVFNATTWQGSQVITKGLTTIAAGSNNKTLPQSTINVADTSAFPTSGEIAVDISGTNTIISYAGTTATSFTGCTGGSGRLLTGQSVALVDPVPNPSMGLTNLPVGCLVYIEMSMTGTFTLGIGNGVIQ